MNQIEYLTNHTFRHHLYTTLITQYTKVCPLKLRMKSSREENYRRISYPHSRLPSLDREKIKNRAETLDVPTRVQQPIIEEVHSQGFKIITARVNVINTYNQILNIERVGHRMQKYQLLKYLGDFYSNYIVEQINKILKLPETLTLQIFEQIVCQISQLDRQGYLNFCFQLYDLQGQGIITSINLLNLLSIEKNEAIEKDLLNMIKSKQNILKQQLYRTSGSTEKQLQTIIINHKKSIKGRKLMISQIEDDSNQIIVQPINRLKLIDKQQFFKIWNDQIPIIGLDLFNHLNDIQQ